MVIRYRAWDKHVKKIRKVTEIHFDDSLIYLKANNGKGYYCSFSDIELMQSTGLKDKNGVEIFEGDVVRYTWDMLSDVNATEKGKKVRISKVFWSDWRASWAVGKKSCNNDLFRYARNGNTVEVIGNVWEDGDLINDSEGAEEN